MGVHVRNIPLSADKDDVTILVHDCLPSLAGHPSYPAPVNFDFFLVKDKVGFRRHAGFGFLTFPDVTFDEQIIQRSLYRPLELNGSRLTMGKARQEDRDVLVRRLREQPWRDPRAAQAERTREKALQSPIQTSSVGWGLECRDGVMSIELDRPIASGQLVVDSDKKRLDILAPGRPNIRIPLHSISLLTVDRDANPPCLYLTLQRPPSFEEYPPTAPLSDDPFNLDSILLEIVDAFGRERPPPIPHKVSSLDEEHARISPYLNDMRVVLTSAAELDKFLDKAAKVHLDGSRLLFNSIHFAQRQLYSQYNLDRLDHWYRSIDITLAMACAALVQNSLLDPTELLSIRHDIMALVRDRRMDVEGTEQALSRLSEEHWKLYGWEDDDGVRQDAMPLKELLAEIAEEVAAGRDAEASARVNARDESNDDADPETFKCFHLVHTPTAFFISPRQPERTNRIVRKYIAHQGRFLRVNFRSVHTNQHHRHTTHAD